ncbi:MAG: hypothetical protein WD733_02185 [Bryobacterales bacterium]
MKTLSYFAVLTASLLALAAVPSWAGPQRLGAEDLAALQMKAASAEDHLKLATHFQAEAEAFGQQAERHAAMGKRYDQPKFSPKMTSLNRDMARHCVKISRSLKEAAKEAEQLAKSHEAMAEETAKQK